MHLDDLFIKPLHSQQEQPILIDVRGRVENEVKTETSVGKRDSVDFILNLNLASSGIRGILILCSKKRDGY